MRYSASGGDLEMNEILMMIGFLVFWIVLQRYILPKLGVQT